MIKKSILLLIALFFVKAQATDFYVVKYHTIKLEGYIQALAWHPKEKLLAIGNNNNIDIFETNFWKPIQIIDEYNCGHTGIVNSVVFSPDGNMLASSSYDKTIKIWQRNKEGIWRLKQTLDTRTNQFNFTAFSPDGKTLIFCSNDGLIKICQRSNKKSRWVLKQTLDEAKAVALSPDGNMIVSCSSDKTIKIWQLNQKGEWVLIQTINETNDKTNRGYSDYSVVFSPDGNTFVSCSWDGLIKIWQLKNGKWVLKQTIDKTNGGHTDCVSSVAFSPDGQTLVSCSNDGLIKIWQLKNGKWVLKQTIDKTNGGHTDCVSSVAFSPDGRYLASGSEKEVIIWKIVKQGLKNREKIEKLYDMKIRFSDGCDDKTKSDELTSEIDKLTKDFKEKMQLS